MGALKQGALAAEVHVISPRFLPLVLEEPTHLATESMAQFLGFRSPPSPL